MLCPEVLGIIGVVSIGVGVYWHCVQNGGG